MVYEWKVWERKERGRRRGGRKEELCRFYPLSLAKEMQRGSSQVDFVLTNETTALLTVSEIDLWPITIQHP
jgi:hypothetical protein